jgi:hypothetical protein
MKKLLLLIYFLPWLAISQQQTINIGTTANDGTGDPLRSAMQKINENFTESYANILTAATSSGTNTYSVSPDPAVPSLANGRRILVTFSNANTSGTVTLNASSLGAQPVKDNEGNDLTIGAIPAGGSFILRYNGTQWRVVGSAGGGSGGVQTIVAGTNITVDDTDPENPIISASGGGGSLSSVGITIGSSGTDAAAVGSPLTSDGSITLNLPSASGSNRGLLTPADWTTFNGKSPAAGSGSLTTTGTLTSGTTGAGFTVALGTSTITGTLPSANGGTIGVHDLFVSAAAMWPRVTSGCAPLNQVEIPTSLVNIQSYDFDQTTQEFAQMQIALPRKWNGGTVTAVVYWTGQTGSGTVQWEISGAAYSNDDPLTATLGTAVEIDDTLIAINDLHVTPTSGNITFSGTPADADFLAIQISRDPSADNLTGDAKLLGISLRLTTNASVDE